jgi:hypothetical protein
MHRHVGRHGERGVLRHLRALSHVSEVMRPRGRRRAPRINALTTLGLSLPGTFTSMTHRDARSTRVAICEF